MRNRVRIGKAERADHAGSVIRVRSAALYRETSRGQCRAGLLAVTCVHSQPASSLPLHLVRAQLLHQPPLMDHAEAGGDARYLAEQVARQKDGDATVMRQFAQKLADLDDARW